MNNNEAVPKAAGFFPTTIKVGRDVQPGETKYWCTCGLCKNQPWSDGDCKGMKPMKWVVPQNQKLFSICRCKFSRKPPICDGSHMSPTGLCKIEDIEDVWVKYYRK